MSLSDSLHRTPWGVLLLGGLALLVALGLFVIPFGVINLAKSGATPAENRAIKREIGATFSEEAIDISASVLRGMRSRTKDPARQVELDRALAEIEQARESVREAGREVQRATLEAHAEARAAIEDARRQAQESADEAKREAERTAREALEGARPDGPPVIPPPPGAVLPALPPTAPTAPGAPSKPSAKHIIVKPLGGHSSVDIEIDDDEDAKAPPGPPVVLPAPQREQIRERVVGDIRRIGLGAGLIVLFIPLFLLATIAKFFIDRSRAAQDVAELKRREAEFHRMGQQVTEAKLSALQAQVEPHFLYNTLASVQALTEIDPVRAHAMTGHLIQYLRNALPKMRESGSTVGQEVELVRAYLSILQMRMGERLAFEIDVPPELMALPFPPLMLPSLVENAIKHGLEPQREGGSVRIEARDEGGALRLTVADTGRGFADTLGEGVGLVNIRERLAALYGDRARLLLEANEPRGVRATIEVPRDGARAESTAAGSTVSLSSVAPAAPASAARRTLAVMGTAERAWRKGLSFAFVGLVCVAAVLAGLLLLAVATGAMPVQVGDESIGGPAGALLGTAGVAVAFAAVVIAITIVVVVIYGLGFLAVGLAIFIPLAVLVSIFPVLAPFILLGLGVWWLVRRSQRAEAAAAASPPAPPPGPPAAP